MASIWDPITIRGVTFQNRIGVSPMCMYSSVNGFPDQSFHAQHIFSRVQGMGLFMIEASGVEDIGRISRILHILSYFAIWNLKNCILQRSVWR